MGELRLHLAMTAIEPNKLFTTFVVSRKFPIFLEKKGVHALKSYLALRPESVSQRVFLNYQGEPISERGIRKLVVKYRKEAGITKKASCHTLRHYADTQTMPSG